MIVFNNPYHGVAIANRAGTSYNSVSDTSIANVTKDGELLGGVIFQNFTGHGGSIGMHVAGVKPNWISHDMLWVAFNYPFEQLGVKKIFGQVPASNQKALEFDLKIGFKVVATIDDVYKDGPCILLAMARDECRWLKLKPRSLRAK